MDEEQLRTLFWPAISQIVPVYALALVVEARRIASRWRKLPAGLRIGSAWTLGVASALLVMTQGLALGMLQSGAHGEIRSTIAVVGVSLATALIAWGPIVSLLLIGNFEAVLIMERLLPWSEWWTVRANGKELQVVHLESIRSNLQLWDMTEVGMRSARDLLRAIGEKRRRALTMRATLEGAIRSGGTPAAVAGAEKAIRELDVLIAEMMRDRRETKGLLRRYRREQRETGRRTREHLRYIPGVEALIEASKLTTIRDEDRALMDSRLAELEADGPQYLSAAEIDAALSKQLSGAISKARNG